MKYKFLTRTKFLILPIILIITIILTACGGTDGTQTASTSAPPTEESPLPTFEPTEETETPATQAPSTSDSEISFSKDIFPIFQTSCFQCHGNSGSRAGFSLNTYDQLMAGGNSGAAIEPGDADNSLLVKLVVSKRMPKGGASLTPEQIQLITDWVNQGALDN